MIAWARTLWPIKQRKWNISASSGASICNTEYYFWNVGCHLGYHGNRMNQSEASNEVTWLCPFIITCYGLTNFKYWRKCYFWNVHRHLGYHGNGMKQTNQKPQMRSHDLVFHFHHLGLSITFVHWITDESQKKTDSKPPNILLLFKYIYCLLPPLMLTSGAWLRKVGERVVSIILKCFLAWQCC